MGVSAHQLDASPPPAPCEMNGSPETALKHFAPALILALVFTAPVQAQTPPTRDPAQIQAGTYRVDPGHTQVGWRVSHMGFSNYSGGFSDVSGTLELQPRNPSASKLSVKIPVASVA